jgi:UBX domain-containing protein 1
MCFVVWLKYAHSGMMVQEPSRGQRDVDALFNRVRQSGSAREGPLEPSPAAPSNRGVFSGTARTLAGEPRQQEQAAGATPVTGTPQAPQPVLHVITFWRNGFTVGDGPLRRLDDPANAPFLDSINKAECPRELEPADRNTPVHVNLVRKEEDWQAPPEPKYVAFKGTGRTLGSTSESTALSQLAAPAVSSSEPPNLPFEGLVVDDTKPATSIQLRLSDGTRMVARFNHTHTVADIRGFIDAARPGNSGPYNLQTMGFPPRQLTDPQQTIQSAGLINAVIIQKN